MTTTLDPAAVASLLLRKLSPVQLVSLARAWHYEAGELPNFQGATNLTVHDLIKLGRWKLNLREGMKDRAVINRLRENNNERVEAVTRVAFTAARSVPQFPSIAAGVLSTLEGIGIPLATTILASVYPKDFGILDRWAWSSLIDVVPELHKGGAFQAGDVDYYEAILRSISKRCADERIELTCRDIDKALWQQKRPSG